MRKTVKKASNVKRKSKALIAYQQDREQMGQRIARGEFRNRQEWRAALMESAERARKLARQMTKRERETVLTGLLVESYSLADALAEGGYSVPGNNPRKPN